MNTPNDKARADLALTTAVQGAHNMLATQQPAVDAAGFDYTPVFLQMMTRLYLMGVMWRQAEEFDLPLKPRERNSVAMLLYLVGEGMNQKQATRTVQQLNGIARPTDQTDHPVVLAGYHATQGDGSLAATLQLFRNEPKAAGRPYRILDRSKLVAAAAGAIGLVLALAMDASWPKSIGIAVVAALIPLGVALGAFHWMTRPVRR